MIPEEGSEQARREAAPPSSAKREQRKVEAAARSFTRAAPRRDGRLICARLLAAETRRRVESTMRMPCERYYRLRARASGRLLIERTRLYGRVAMVDARTTGGTSGVLIFLRDARRGWLFLRELVVPASPSPDRRGEQSEGLSVS